MFKGYNLDMTISEKQAFLNISDKEIEEYEEKYKDFRDELKIKMNTVIKLPREENNKIDGSGVITDWFPNYNSDVFISHSHNDARTAKRLAVWLNKNFGLTVFIDSIVWGSANALLKEIDNNHCVLKDVKGHKTYNYNIRNYTTSHVHMMLSTALGDIIDQTECLIFLNTPESLSINEAKDKKTNSPWIYNELKIASIIRRKYPRKIKNKILLEKSFTEFAEKRKLDLEILYSVDEQLAQMETLNTSKLKNWLDLYSEKFNGEVHPLDILYFDSEIVGGNILYEK